MLHWIYGMYKQIRHLVVGHPGMQAHALLLGVGAGVVKALYKTNTLINVTNQTQNGDFLSSLHCNLMTIKANRTYRCIFQIQNCKRFI